MAALGACRPGALAAIRLLFPDPWPKRRHVARRMVDRAFAGAAAEASRPAASHLATDWADYAEHARDGGGRARLVPRRPSVASPAR
ncbi:MAG: hypothetical protein R2711_10615 [Acidimicrobiales bacterium]